jgi:hypothetical protein
MWHQHPNARAYCMLLLDCENPDQEQVYSNFRQGRSNTSDAHGKLQYTVVL